MQSFTFEYPVVFLFLTFFVWSAFFFRVKEQYYFLPNIVDNLPAQTHQKSRVRSLHFLSIVFAFMALASPIYVVQEVDKSEHTLDIVLSIDTSGSMSLNGLSADNYEKTRLDVVKSVVKEFIQERKKDTIGLVLFGDRSGVASALSSDTQALISRVNAVTVGIFGKSTALIDSILQSTLLLQKSTSSTKIIILLSDGDDTASKVPLSIALKLAHKEHIKIYTISIGKSNNNLLKLIANESGAKSFMVNSKKDLQKVYVSISKLEAKTENKTAKKVLYYEYKYFIMPTLLFFLLFLYFSQKTSPQKIKKLFSVDMFKKVLLYPELEKKRDQFFLYLAIIVILLLTLGLSFYNTKELLKTNVSKPLLIALDISPSMCKQDVFPSRFEVAKKKIVAFLQRQQHLQVALILFNKNAYLAYPMSRDIETLKSLIKTLEPTQNSGTNLFAALEGSEFILHVYNEKNILLFSDGGTTEDFSDELDFLKKHHIILSSLYINSDMLQGEKIQSLSLESGGNFSFFDYGQKDVESLTVDILALSNFRTSQHFYLYFLFIGVFLLVYTYVIEYDLKRRYKGLFFMSILSIYFMHTELKADLLDFKKLSDAKAFYVKKEYKSAINIYEQMSQTKQIKYNLANALYKNREYKKAITKYKQAFTDKKDLNANIYYNIANAYFFLHKLHAAKKYYILSLKLKSDLMAQENLQRVLLILQNKKKGKRQKYELPKNTSSYKVAQREISSNYTVRLNRVIPNEEEKWMQKIKGNKVLLFLQKLPTHRVSDHGMQND